ncbi:MAG: YciI family protein [Rhodospirillales bacterium]|nr:YciI family protein [Rhodospirillales bacterium]
MLFHIRCKDKPSQMNMRASTRAVHLKYLTNFGDSIFFAGPTYTDEGETVTGSVFLIDLEDMAAAEDFAKGDPYRKVGLFESVEIEQIRKVIPADD